MSFLDGYRYETMPVLRIVGCRSGSLIIIGLGYSQFSPEVSIVASKSGANDHPQWYLNLRASGPVVIQIATQAFNAAMDRALHPAKSRDR